MWAIAAAGGVVLLSRPGVTASVSGVVFALAAAASVAISILLARRAGQQSDGLQSLSLSIVVAAVLTFPIGIRAAFATPDAGALVTVAAVGSWGSRSPTRSSSALCAALASRPTASCSASTLPSLR